MSVKLMEEKAGDGMRKVTLTNGADFWVRIVPPTFGQRLANKTLKLNALTRVGEPGSDLRHRLDSCLKDWTDVTDADDKPIPFTMAAFESLCSRFPEALNQVLEMCTAEFSPPVGTVGNSKAGGSAKSSEPPCEEEVQESSETSSQSGSSCGEQAGSDDHLDSNFLT